MGGEMKEDFVDRLTVFLAKRDGIDKVVKTCQYVSRLAHWRLQDKNPGCVCVINVTLHTLDNVKLLLD